MRSAFAVFRALLPYVLPAVAIVLLGYLATMPRPRVVVVEKPVAPATPSALTAAAPRPPVLQVTDNELVYQGRLLATVDSVRNDSPIFRIDALIEALNVTADEIIESIPGDRLRRDRDQICANNRDTHPGLHILCPGRTLVIEIDENAYFDARLMAVIGNSASAAGYHAAFAKVSFFTPHYSGLAR